MESDSCASGMFPSNRCVTWRSVASPGFRRDEFPCFDGTMERSDLLRPAHRARLPSRGDTMRCARLVRSQRPRHETAGLGLVIRAPRTGWMAHGDDQDLSGSWGILVCLRPALRPRQNRPIRPYDVVGAAPAFANNKGFRDKSLFEAQSHGFSTCCLRFAVRVARCRRKTRFPLLAALRGGICLPAGFQRKVSKVHPTSHSSFPELFLTQWQSDFLTLEPSVRVVMSSTRPFVNRLFSSPGIAASRTHGLPGHDGLNGFVRGPAFLHKNVP